MKRVERGFKNAGGPDQAKELATKRRAGLPFRVKDKFSVRHEGEISGAKPAFYPSKRQDNGARKVKRSVYYSNRTYGENSRGSIFGRFRANTWSP